MDNQVLPPTVKGISLSRTGNRKSQTLLAAVQHNKRDVGGRGWRHKSEPQRICLNRCLAGPETPEGVVARHATLMAHAGYRIRRKDYLQAVEIVFTTPAEFRVDHGEYLAWCLAWLTGHYGGDITLSADAHYDEGPPHLHVLVVPVIGGQWVGSDFATPKTWPEVQAMFGVDVGAKFGLKLVPQLKGKKLADAAQKVRAALAELLQPHISGDLLAELLRLAGRRPGGLIKPLGLEDEMSSKSGDGGAAFKRIALSTGKGPKRERSPIPYGIKASAFDEEEIPYGIENSPEIDPEKSNPILVSGIGFFTANNSALPAPSPDQPLSNIPNADGEIAAPATATQQQPTDRQAATDDESQATTRERDDDQAAGTWCEQTGDFMPTPPAPTRAARTSMGVMLSDGLLTRGRLPGQRPPQSHA